MSDHYDSADLVDPRNYSVGTRAALALLSRGACYWPGCGHPIVKSVTDVEGRYSADCQIAHIHSADRNGPRFDDSMSNDQRRQFPNLIYPCKAHHSIVDDMANKEKFPAEGLLKWKTDREAEGIAALSGLRELTEDRLQEIIAEAYELSQKQILDVIERVKVNDTEAAGLMRQMFDELEQFRQSNLYADIDTAVLLNEASHNLAGLADTADTLTRAADGLQNLHDDALTLNTAARQPEQP